MMVRWMRRVFAPLFVIFVLWTSTFGSLTFMLPSLPFAFIGGRHARRMYIVYTNFWTAFWLTSIIAYLKILLRLNFRREGAVFPSNERSLIVMNHRTRLDWMYLWDVHLGSASWSALHWHRIALKDMLKSVPGCGWAMQLTSYLFLQRSSEVDLRRMEEYARHLRDSHPRFNLLYFPEGTNLTDNTKAHSDAFAEKNDLPKYDYVLHPRTTGFEHLFQQLVLHDNVDCLYDVTIAYKGHIITNEMHFLKGKLPDDVIFFIDRIPIKTLLPDRSSSEDCRPIVKKFLEDSFQRKERRLREFYSNAEQYSEQSLPIPSSVRPWEWMAFMFWWLFSFLSIIYLVPQYWYIYGVAIIVLVIWTRFFAGPGSAIIGYTNPDRDHGGKQD